MPLGPALLCDDLLDLLDDSALAVALLTDELVAVTHELLALVKEYVASCPEVEV